MILHVLGLVMIENEKTQDPEQEENRATSLQKRKQQQIHIHQSNARYISKEP